MTHAPLRPLPMTTRWVIGERVRELAAAKDEAGLELLRVVAVATPEEFRELVASSV